MISFTFFITWHLRFTCVKTNFTPGPSQLYFTVEDHARRAFRDGIPSLTHRSKEFENMYASVKEGLSELLQLPSDYHVLFTASATEIWERVIENLVEESSLHFVNGSFSARFYEIAKQLNRQPELAEVKEGLGFKNYSGNGRHEVVGLTHNETSTGVSLPLEFIHSFRAQQPDALVVVDAVSSLPYPSFDYKLIDSAFFSVQKAFGLPAGLGVWLANDRCIAKAERLLAKGKSIGSYHTLPGLMSFAKKNQTPETPNVLGIYLLSKVLEDFNRKGITQLRRETEYKAAILYQALEQSKTVSPFVHDTEFRSKTVIVAHCGDKTKDVASVLQSKELFPGDGYGKSKQTQLRFANFPTHSKEQYELLADTLAAL